MSIILKLKLAILAAHSLSHETVEEPSLHTIHNNDGIEGMFKSIIIIIIFLLIRVNLS